MLGLIPKDMMNRPYCSRRDHYSFSYYYQFIQLNNILISFELVLVSCSLTLKKRVYSSTSCGATELRHYGRYLECINKFLNYEKVKSI